MEGKRTSTILALVLGLSILTSNFYFLAGRANAASASLYLSPSIGTYTVGNTFLVQLKLNSGGVAINAADGTLVFDPDKLEVVALPKTDSVFTLWVQEPVFSNSVGTVDFAGGKPSPGFTGSAGTIVNITFKAKVSGNANLTFAVGSVLADDGKGTNILTNMGSGSYSLSARIITPLSPSTPSVPSAPSVSGTPGLPVVYSPTHPNEDEWYSSNDPEFNWELSSDVTGVSLLLHEKPTGDPGPTSDGLLDSKKFEDAEDGAWYFHIKFRNQYGWGSILHRKVLIDTVSPLPFEVTVDNDGDLTNPTPTLHFSTTDSLSGIEYYEVKVVDEKVLITEAERKKNPFVLPPQVPGTTLVEVKAFDKAGNSSLATAEFEILPILGVPVITNIPKRIKIGETLIIEGVALPGAKAVVYIQKGGEEFEAGEAGADGSGEFVFFYEKPLAKGDYLVWARTKDERGALSEPTEQHSLEVGLPPVLQFGTIALDYLSIMTTLIVLIVGAIAIIFYSWYRISVWRRRVRYETKEVAQSVLAAFKALKEEVEEQVAMIDQKPGLNKREKEIRDKLQEALDISEKFIGKEISDIEKELD
ncbi:MAG: cohesin domain-containing protein [bacterium]|nr:cohesin domain-containing protein [bacterium]